MPNQIDAIMQALGGATAGPPKPTGQPQSPQGPMGYSELQSMLRQNEASGFTQWLRTLGIDLSTLDPQVRLMYYQLWMQLSGKGGQQSGMRMGG